MSTESRFHSCGVCGEPVAPEIGMCRNTECHYTAGRQAERAHIGGILRSRAEGLFAAANGMRMKGQDARADKREVAGIAVLAAADAIHPEGDHA